jgi:hypothetical protein
MNIHSAQQQQQRRFYGEAGGVYGSDVRTRDLAVPLDVTSLSAMDRNGKKK